MNPGREHRTEKSVLCCKGTLQEIISPSINVPFDDMGIVVQDHRLGIS